MFGRLTRQNSLLLNLVTVGVIFMLLGRAWQHLLWNGVLSYKVYDEYFVQWFVEGIWGGNWGGFLVDGKISKSYLLLLKSIGVLWILISLLFVKASRFRSWTIYGIVTLILLLYIPYIFSHFIGHSFILPSIFELSNQILIPVLLLLALRSKLELPGAILVMKAAVAATFISHGLFAIYLFPIPSNFLVMTRNILHLDTNQAIIFLRVVGWADIVCSILIFLPRVCIPALIYMTIWGVLTALARPLGSPYTGELLYHLNRWIPEVLIRFPNFILPAILLLIELKRNRVTGKTKEVMGS